MDISEKEARAFFATLAKIIGADGTWENKKQALLEFADEADETNLEELAAWFE